MCCQKRGDHSQEWLCHQDYEGGHPAEHTDTSSVLKPRMAFRTALSVVEFAPTARNEHFHLVFDP